mmetsp:Transcript_41459/g.56518  ORF Transcript_41459/g.56518 Transcript_41459/m.56518 type:complete len:298 (-) Transcript_41459:201-1094(-)
MVFCGFFASSLVYTKGMGLPLPTDFVIPPSMSWSKYTKSVFPIAALQAASLWLSNLAYLYISVSLIQMIKASNTVWTYLWTVGMGLAIFNKYEALNLGFIGVGIAITCTGAANGSMTGMSIQLAGIIIEALRLAMLQLVTQQHGFKLSPITALYYIAPASVPLLLAIAVANGEVSSLMSLGWNFPLWMMVTNMMLAFSLNFIGILVIKRMSAVAYVLSGVCKDIILVTMGGVIWSEVITDQQICGYAIALTGLAYYNYSSKMKVQKPPSTTEEDREGLMDGDSEMVVFPDAKDARLR